MRIRPFTPDDAAGVAALWQYWFRTKTRDPDPGLVDLARHIYAEHPNRAEGITSLVAEDDDGAMLGFLGVSVTPVSVDGEPATLAGVFPSVIDPERASSAVASLLLRRFLAGPQAFTFSDGGHEKFERIWESLGGRIAQLQSLRWVKLFRPATVAVDAFTDGSRRPLRPVLRPLAAGGDWLARRTVPQRLRSLPPRAAHERRPQARLLSEPLDAPAVVAVCEELHRGMRLRPRYDASYLQWLFTAMASIVGQGAFTARVVRDPAGGVAGWYVAYLRPGGVSRVFVLEAHPRFVEGVIDELFTRAEEAGVGALIGRLGPRLRRPMVARGCLVYGGGSLQMLHARDAGLVDAVELGRVALSRLEGENWYWWAIVSERVPVLTGHADADAVGGTSDGS